MRVAYPMSAGHGGGVAGVRVFDLSNGVLVLQIPRDLAFLDGEHLRGRVGTNWRRSPASNSRRSAFGNCNLGRRRGA